MRVPVRRDCSGDVDEVHQPSAQKVSQWIGIVRQNHFCHLGL